MSEGGKIKWLVAGVVVIVIGVFWFRAAQNYQEPLHITPKDAHKAVDSLTGLKEEVSGDSAVIPLPGREPMAVDDPEGGSKQGGSKAKQSEGKSVLVGNQLPVLNTSNWITGKVVVKGGPPAAKPLAMDPNCAAIAKQTFPDRTLMTRDFRLGPDRGLADVVVILDDIKDAMAGVDMKPLELTIEGCQLHPPVLVSIAGQPINLRNKDSEFHSVSATPKVMPNPIMNYMLFPKGPATILNYQGAEENIRITIEERPWAESFLTVVSHPYFSLTDSNGVFRIPMPPKGNYQIKAKHRKLAAKIETVAAVEGKDSVINFELEYQE